VGDLNVPGTGLAVYPVSHRIPTDGGGELLYNTLVKITMTAYGPVAERLVPQLFYVRHLPKQKTKEIYLQLNRQTNSNMAALEW
jgi:hypothetical protein